MRDRRALAEVRTGETAHAGFRGIEHVKAEEFLLEFGEFWLGDDDVRSDAAAAGDLPAGIGQSDFRRMIGNFALVVIFVERNGFVVALNQAPAGSVVTGG